jgi:hypothetical protein
MKASGFHVVSDRIDNYIFLISKKRLIDRPLTSRYYGKKQPCDETGGRVRAGRPRVGAAAVMKNHLEQGEIAQILDIAEILLADIVQSFDPGYLIVAGI